MQLEIILSDDMNHRVDILEARSSSGSAEATPISEADAVATVVRMLAKIGFAPELSADQRVISLRRYPFRELAEKHPDVVCGAHLGMVRDALAELGAPVRATNLLPFVQPDLCFITLSQ